MNEKNYKTAEKKGAIPSEVDILASRIDILEETARELGEKLPPILRPLEPTESDEKCQEVIYVPLAADIEVNSGKVSRVNRFLRDIIERLEL